VSRAALYSVVFLAGCSLDGPRREVLSEGVPKSGNVVALERVTIDRFEEDRLTSRASIERAEIDREKHVITGEMISIRVLDGRGGETAHVAAPRGNAELGARTVVLEGGVELVDQEKRTVRSDRMIYDAARDAIEAPGPVTIEGENFRADGHGLVAKRREGTVELGGPARVTTPKP
jgi:LPS export ABC transporter protein LptC